MGLIKINFEQNNELLDKIENKEHYKKALLYEAITKAVKEYLEDTSTSAEINWEVLKKDNGKIESKAAEIFIIDKNDMLNMFKTLNDMRLQYSSVDDVIAFVKGKFHK